MQEALEIDEMILGQLVVVDAVDDGEVGPVGRRRDDDPLRARLQMRRSLLARGEDARALHHDVDAKLLVRQLGRILDRGHLHLVPADHDRIALDCDFVGKATVNAVEPQ